MESTTGSFSDAEGRLWVWDKRAKVWYAPDWGLEFKTRAEVIDAYGLSEQADEQ